MKKGLTSGSILVLLLLGCERQPPQTVLKTAAPSASPVPWTDADKSLFSTLSPQDKEMFVKMKEDDRLNGLIEARVRAELVRPTPPGWKAHAIGREIALTLIPAKTRLNRGEKFWYRLEARNVGREPIYLTDHFFTDWRDIGGAMFFPDHRFSFELLDASGRITPLEKPAPVWADARPTEFSLPGWNRMTPEEKARDFSRWSEETRVAEGMFVRLRSGETITTAPTPSDKSWSQSVRDRLAGGPSRESSDAYRILPCEYQFSSPGKYRIRAVYSDPPPPPVPEALILRGLKRGRTRESYARDDARWRREALGRVESNTVEIEVAP